MIEVLIALVEPLLSMGIVSALNGSGECRVVGTVGKLEGVEGAVRSVRPQVVVLDVQFQRDDRDLIPRLVKHDPTLKVLVLVDHSDEECALRSLLADPDAARFSEEALQTLDECCLTALRSSASGCVARTSDSAHLLQAIQTVMAGGIAAAPWLAAIVGVGPTASGSKNKSRFPPGNWR